MPEALERTVEPRNQNVTTYEWGQFADKVTDVCKDYCSEEIRSKIELTIWCVSFVSLCLLIVPTDGALFIIPYGMFMICGLVVFALRTNTIKHQTAVDARLVAICTASPFMDADVGLSYGGLDGDIIMFVFYPKNQAPPPQPNPRTVMRPNAVPAQARSGRIAHGMMVQTPQMQMQMQMQLMQTPQMQQQMQQQMQLMQTPQMQQQMQQQMQTPQMQQQMQLMQQMLQTPAPQALPTYSDSVGGTAAPTDYATSVGGTAAPTDYATSVGGTAAPTNHVPTDYVPYELPSAQDYYK